MSEELLADRGNITSDEYRPASKCEDCRSVWYTQDNSEYCPRCGGQNVVESAGLPGALLLNPGVEWPEDDPFVGGHSE